MHFFIVCRCMILIFALIVSATAFERVINYRSCISVFDFATKGDTLYVASSGGTYVFNKTTETGTLLPSTIESPDPDTRAICIDQSNKLWTGSQSGYLTKRNIPKGYAENLSASYISADWEINDILPYGKHLFIASDKGFSIFNTEQFVAQENATKIGTLPSANINVLSIYKDTLFAGLDVGLAKIFIGKGINNLNLYNSGAWSIDSSIHFPVHSFIHRNGCQPVASLSAVSGNKVLQGDSNTLYVDSLKFFTFPSAISAITVVNESEWWIGTEENYFYKWNGIEFKQFQIPGLTISPIMRVKVSSTGKMWFLPFHNGEISRWWAGLGSFDNTKWRIYTIGENVNYYLGGDPSNRGIIETPDNRLWFGTSGGQIKTYNPSNDSWRFYHPNEKENAKFFSSSSLVRQWGKIDAFAVDSSGFLWISNWRNYTGGLICYDYKYEPDDTKTNPTEAHYKRFFASTDLYRSDNFTCLHVDKENNIFAGSDSGELVIFRFNGNPLTSPMQVLKSMKGLIFVYDALTLDSGKTYIATENGMYIYDPEINTLTLEAEKFGKNCRVLESENGKIMWIGTAADGLIRYNSETGVSTKYARTNGLISNKINDISFDRKNGYLWVATESGFSRLDLGYSLDHEVTSNELQIFPNPYSVTTMRSIQLSFTNVPTDGDIMVYGADGQLVGKPLKHKTGTTGMAYTWMPGKDLKPGVYNVVVKSKSGSKSKRILITP
jgi:ligand-binding sensor domain-containing protein